MNKKPDQIVAEKIINQMLSKKLLPEEHAKEWTKKILQKKASVEEWNLLADQYADQYITDKKGIANE